MKRNITKYEPPVYPVRKRKPLLHHFVTNLIASFAEITSLKKYAMFMFAFLLLLLMSGSYNIFAKENNEDSYTDVITRIDSYEDLSPAQQQLLNDSINSNKNLYSLEKNGSTTQSGPYPSAEGHVYLMSNISQSFPYTIFLAGSDTYSINEIALKHYGSEDVIASIKSANPKIDFTQLKTGDRIYLPLVNVSALKNMTEETVSPALESVNDSSSQAETSATEALVLETSPATEASIAVEETVSTTVAETTVISETTTQATETISTTLETTAAPTTVVQTMPAASSYVVSATPEVVDMYVRIVAAESSPAWDYEGQLMIAQTIINRALSGKWGTLSEVLTAPNQYDVYSSGRYLNIHVTDSQRQAAMDALNGITAFERDVIYFCTTYAYSPGSWWGTLDHRATHDNTMFFAP